MSCPDRPEAVRHLEAGRAVALARELPADLLTPMGALLRLLAAAPRGEPPLWFLFESVERGERIGRFSYVGLAPAPEPDGNAGEPAGGDPLAGLRAACAAPLVPPQLPEPPRFFGGVVFALGWELVGRLEPRLAASCPRPAGSPVHWGRFPAIACFDHLRRRLLLLHALEPAWAGEPAQAYARARERLQELEDALARPLGGLPPRRRPAREQPPPAAGAPSSAAAAAGEITVSLTDEAFAAAVERARAYVRAGDVFQVVLARRFARRCPAGAIEVYRELRALNPSPFMFLLRLGGEELLGASPELLCRVEGGEVITHPIAGTRPRGATAAEDTARAAELLADPKERAEHAMLVDLARNDVGRVAVPGSVRVSRHMEVERFSHVMHLVSEVRGMLRPGLGAVEALLACFPAGTVSGAPKVRAIEIIHELEPAARGPYAGAVGIAGPGGTLDSCIAIRAVRLHDGEASWQAGAGIVFDSVAEREVAETLAKARAMEQAVAVAAERAGPGVP
ncbi:MAG: anthranilate synthase component I [Planctomycetota bacterium]|nr:MAG: anthranilate synthase component I [Planctomycetota bacterium]